MASIEVPGILRSLSRDSDAAKLLEDYFTATQQGLPYFSGSRFNSIGCGDADADPNLITAQDIAAILCLGVNLKGLAVIDLLEYKSDEIACHLSKISSEANLWDPSQADIELRDSDANKLWWLLRRINDIGPVKASKLMARKRPRLIPIYDQWIEKALRLGSPTGYWTKCRELMLTSQEGVPLHEQLRSLVLSLDIPQTITPLRACDVILWYSENPSQESRRQSLNLRGGW